MGKKTVSYVIPEKEELRMMCQSYMPEYIPPNWTCLGWSENFGMRYKKKNGLAVIVTVSYEDDEKLWMHISLSYPNKLPKWKEVVECKELFGCQETLAVQVIPPRSEYVNYHPFCLNIFVLLDGERPLPDFRRGNTL